MDKKENLKIGAGVKKFHTQGEDGNIFVKGYSWKQLKEDKKIPENIPTMNKIKQADKGCLLELKEKLNDGGDFYENAEKFREALLKL